MLLREVGGPSASRQLELVQRGLAACSGIMETIVRPAPSAGVTAGDADRLQQAAASAMTDDRHAPLGTMLAGDGAPVSVAVPGPKPKRELANVH